MSKVDELIQELCPDGVERVTLGEVTELKRGTSISRKNTRTGEVPVIAGGLTPAYYIDKANREGEVIVVAGSGANAGFVSFWAEPVFVSDAFSIQQRDDHLSLKYVFHALKSKQDQLYGLKKGGGVPHVYAKDAAAIQIPIPALEVQEEIVRILDAFVELDREIEQEIAGREKQLSGVRTGLLQNNGPSTELNKIAELGTGSRNTADAVENGDYAFYTRGEVVLAMNEYDFDDTSIVTAGDGVGVGKTMHFVSGKYALHQRAYRIHVVNDKFSSRYVFHLMKQSFLSYMERNSVHASVTSIRKWMLQSFPVPELPLIVQEEIAAKLDTFTEYIDNLKRERELRQKQYEYYRDQLLDFKVKE